MVLRGSSSAFASQSLVTVATVLAIASSLGESTPPLVASAVIAPRSNGRVRVRGLQTRTKIAGALTMSRKKKEKKKRDA